MKITFVGAGSFIFTRRFITDILTFEALQDATFTLFDIDEERLGYIKEGAQRIIDEGHYPAKVEATLNRRQALECADAVIISILQGGISVWRKDIEIPKEFGLNISVGDSMGPSGAFRALRTIPVMLEIARDIEKYCPDAIVLNYTNPMSMLSGAVQRYSKVKLVGLCHSVQGTAEMLAKWIGAPMSEISYVCAGINHQAWFLQYNRSGKDAYPEVLDAINKREGVYYQEQVRNEMFKKLGYYVTESSSHNSEYNPWFRKTEEDIVRLCHNFETEEGYAHRNESVKYADKGWNYGRYANTLIYYESREQNWRDYIKRSIAETPDLKRGNEYAAFILNAIYGDGTMTSFNGNILNNGLIANLPDEACVEVPIIASKAGLQACQVGRLPEHLAVLNGIHAQCHNMVVDACMEGDSEKVRRACYLDPLTSAVLRLDDIDSMVNAMFEANKDFLPQFKL